MEHRLDTYACAPVPGLQTRAAAPFIVSTHRPCGGQADLVRFCRMHGMYGAPRMWRTCVCSKATEIKNNTHPESIARLLLRAASAAAFARHVAQQGFPSLAASGSLHQVSMHVVH